MPFITKIISVIHSITEWINNLVFFRTPLGPTVNNTHISNEVINAENSSRYANVVDGGSGVSTNYVNFDSVAVNSRNLDEIQSLPAKTDSVNLAVDSIEVQEVVHDVSISTVNPANSALALEDTTGDTATPSFDRPSLTDLMRQNTEGEAFSTYSSISKSAVTLEDTTGDTAATSFERPSLTDLMRLNQQNAEGEAFSTYSSISKPAVTSENSVTGFEQAVESVSSTSTSTALNQPVNVYDDFNTFISELEHLPVAPKSPSAYTSLKSTLAEFFPKIDPTLIAKDSEGLKDFVTETDRQQTHFLSVMSQPSSITQFTDDRIPYTQFLPKIKSSLFQQDFQKIHDYFGQKYNWLLDYRHDVTKISNLDPTQIEVIQQKLLFMKDALVYDYSKIISAHRMSRFDSEILSGFGRHLFSCQNRDGDTPAITDLSTVLNENAVRNAKNEFIHHLDLQHFFSHKSDAFFEITPPDIPINFLTYSVDTKGKFLASSINEFTNISSSFSDLFHVAIFTSVESSSEIFQYLFHFVL